MIITEDIFTCVREWRRNKLASAFISTNTTSDSDTDNDNTNITNNNNSSSSGTISADEEMLVVLSGMNVVPGKLIISSLDKCNAAIEIHSRCCQISIPFLEEDRLRIIRQLRSRSILDSITGIMNSRMEKSSDENVLSSQHTDKPCNLSIYDFLIKLHSPSCWWRMGDIVRLALKSPRMSFVDSTLIRHRCAAVVLMDNNSNNNSNNNNNNSSTDKSTNINSLLKVSSVLTSSAKLLLPRGSPVSFIRHSLLPSTLAWMRELEMESSCGLTSRTAMEILQALFGLKRTRSLLEEDNDETHNNSNNNNKNNNNDNNSNEKRNSDSDLVPSLCLLFALFGYKIESVPLLHSSNDNNNNNNNNNNDLNEDDRWKRIGANVSCYFCGQKPKLVIQEVVVQTQAEEPEKEEKEETEKEETEKSTAALNEGNEEVEQNNEDNITTTITTTSSSSLEPTSPIKIQTPQLTSTTHYHYTIHLTEQNDGSGHHPNCPWRVLFLRTVLIDCLSPAPSKELQFNLMNIGTRVSQLSVCLQRPEVTKLMECWRRSVYAVGVWGEVYTQHPLPTAVRTSIPPPADGRVEKFLQTLQSRYCGSDDDDDDDDTNTNNNSDSSNSNNSGGLEWHPTQITPLFDRRCFWESCCRVVSVVKAAAATTTTNTTNTNITTNITSSSSTNKELKGDAEVSTSSKIVSKDVGHWKAVYDAGRRCIIAAAEGKDKTILTTASQKFKELYNLSLDQDRSNNDDASGPLSGVMSRLFNLLGDGLKKSTIILPQQLSNDDISAEAKSKQIIELSSQEEKRVQTFLGALDNIVEKASRDPPPQAPPQRLNKTKQPNMEFTTSYHNDKNARQGGITSHNQPKQQLQSQSHQQQLQHQQHQKHHQKHQQQSQQQQKHQQQQQKSHQTFPHHSFSHIQTASTADGILPFPPAGMNTGVLPVPGTMPFIQQQPQKPQQQTQSQQQQTQQVQQQQQQQNFRHGMHSPVFSNPVRGNVLPPDAVGVLNDGYMQRPSIMGQRPIQTGNFAADRKGGRGGNHRGGRGGRGGGRGRNAFK